MYAKDYIQFKRHIDFSSVPGRLHFRSQELLRWWFSPRAPRYISTLFSRRPGKCDFSEFTAIWIFGIFTLAQLQRTRFWDTISRQFQQRGPNYIERCIIQREPHLIAEDDAISPAVFPPLPELDPDTEDLSLSVSEEDMKEVCDILVYFERND